jgi:glycosyltransferase involved in cell wall biosynthesis
LVHDTPENREVAGDAGLYFRAESPATLTALLRRVAGDRRLALELGAKAAARASERYSWERVSESYAALGRELVGRRGDA